MLPFYLRRSTHFANTRTALPAVAAASDEPGQRTLRGVNTGCVERRAGWDPCGVEEEERERVNTNSSRPRGKELYNRPRQAFQ